MLILDDKFGDLLRSLDGVNTPVCEQLFSAINKYTNAKAMNEAHFFIFFLYIFDLHNLQIEGKLRSVANPLSEHRYELLKSVKNNDVDEISDLMANVDVAENDDKLTDPTADKIGEFSCHICASKYKRAAFLKAHLKNKHKEEVTLSVSVCKECGETFESEIALQTHMAKHYTCKMCGIPFLEVKYLNRHIKSQHSPVACKVCGTSCPDKDALDEHMKKHLICLVCGKTFDKMYKLNRHMKSHS